MKNRLVKNFFLVTIFLQFYYPTISSEGFFNLSFTGLLNIISRLEFSGPVLFILSFSEIIKLYKHNKDFRLVLNLYALSILCVIISSSLTYVFNPQIISIEDLIYGVEGGVVRLFLSFLIFASFFAFFIKYSNKSKIFNLILISALLSSVWIIFPFIQIENLDLGVFDIYPLILSEFNEAKSGTIYLFGYGFRYQGFTSSPTIHSFLASVGLMISLFYFFKIKNNKKKIFYLLASILLLITVVLTQTRTFIFSSLIILFFKLIVIDKNLFKFFRFSFIIIPLIFLSFFYFSEQNSIIDDEINLERTSNFETNRLELIKFYFTNKNYTLKSFIIGDGFLYSQKNKILRVDGQNYNAHSLFPDVILENGFIIGILIILIYCLLMYVVFKRNSFEFNSPSYHVFQAILLTFFISNFVTGSLHHIDFQAIIFSLIASNYVIR